MKIAYRILLLMLILTTALSLKKAIPSNPAIRLRSELHKSPATKTSAGYLTCKIDGVLLKAAFPGTMILFVPGKKEVNIWGKTPTGIISITMDNIETTGTYTILGNSKNGAGIMMGSKMYEVKKMGTPFTVSIESIDEITALSTPEAKAIRGTFQGKLMDEDGNIVEITEGKFSTQ